MAKLSCTLMLLLLGCLAAPAQAQQPAPRVDPNQILEPESRASSAQTAYELVQALRPNWLQRRRATSIGDPGGGTLLVFLDGALLGDLEALVEVPAATLKRIEFLSPSAVSLQFQRNSPNGGILLSSATYPHDAGQSYGATDWSRRDSDDYFSVHFSSGWSRPDRSGSGNDQLQRGVGTVVGVAVPLRPDVFLRLTYFHHAFQANSARSSLPDEPHRVTWSGGSIEWKGQLSDTDRFTPYAVAGISFQWLRQHSLGEVSENEALGYLVGLGLDVRVADPLNAFVETGYAKARREEGTAPLRAVQPLRAGLSLAPLRLARR
jgi:opacity protein-like surface antigen